MAISQLKCPGSAHAREVTSEQAEPVVSAGRMSGKSPDIRDRCWGTFQDISPVLTLPDSHRDTIILLNNSHNITNRLLLSLTQSSAHHHNIAFRQLVVIRSLITWVSVSQLQVSNWCLGGIITKKLPVRNVIVTIRY